MATSVCPRWRIVFIALSCVWVMLPSGMATGRPSGAITVNDVLTLPHETARIEARLSGDMPAAGPGWGGVRLQLEIDGKPVAAATTNESGEASFDYRPSMRGINMLTVTVVGTESVEAKRGEATLCVWERRRPILLIELEALVQPDTLSTTVAPEAQETMFSTQPVADAADELSLLTQYYYNVMYVPIDGRASERGPSAGAMRRWLKAHKFPAGFIVTLPTGGLTAAIEEYKRGGWTSMKSGVGRTRTFAEALLHQRMEVVVVPEPPKGGLPRKAKTAKDWKEVRKKL